MTLVSQLAARGSCTWRNSCSTQLGPRCHLAQQPQLCLAAGHLLEGTILSRALWGLVGLQL